MRSRFALLAVLLLSGCGRHGPPPSPLSFDGLPVAGSLADARAAGFTRCIRDTTFMRCRRPGVMLQGQGPYEAAVDLAGSDGGGGFDQLTLWHDRNQNALFAVGDTLRRQGWEDCYTGEGDRGDQVVFTRDGESVRLSMDLSYWGKRRLRVMPLWNKKEPGCEPR